jgi:nitrate reductase gamma subunit
MPRAEMRSRTSIHVVAGYLFHLGLFALLFFAAPHVLFIEAQTGLGWTAMPYWAFIVAAQFAFIGLLLLWIHRVMHPVTRLISDADDHIASILTFIVMLTGCMALIEQFDGLRVFHRFTVELLMVYFPFSRLMHAFMFIPSRAFTGAWFGRRGVKA